MPYLKCHNVIVVRTDRIGDVVLTTPVFKAIRNTLGSCRITVLVTPLTADLVRGNPYVDEVMVDDRHNQHKGVLGVFRLIRDIRRRKFDTALILHTKRRTNIGAFLAGVPQRIGYRNNKFGFFLTHPIADPRALGQKHEAEYCLDLLQVLGIHNQPLDCFIPAQKEAEAWATGWFEANHIPAKGAIAIHPGASDPTKVWPSESFIQLIHALKSHYNGRIILIGGAETQAISSRIAQSCGDRVLNMTGQMNLGQMASLLRRCRLIISNDSGPAHVAAGVGIYVIALFLRHQPGINPCRWRPLGPKAAILTNKPGEEIELDERAQVAGGKMDSICVAEVLSSVEKIMQQDSQSVFHW